MNHHLTRDAKGASSPSRRSSAFSAFAIAFTALLAASPVTEAAFPVDPDILNGIFASFSGEERNPETNQLLSEWTLETTEEGSPVPGHPEGSVGWDEEFLFGTTVGFFIQAFSAEGATDPWAAFRLSAVNSHPIPVQFFIDMRFGIVEMPGIADVKATLDVTVEDTSGNGTASYLTDFARFSGWNFDEFVFDEYPGSGFTPQFDVQAGQTVRQVDAAGSIDPSVFGGTLYDEMYVRLIGILSPGDTVTFEGYTCLVAPGDACPDSPLLGGTQVPIPPTFWLLGSAILGVLARRRQAK